MRSPAFPGLGHAGISFQTGDGAAEQHWRARNWGWAPKHCPAAPAPRGAAGAGAVPGGGAGGPAWVRDGADPPARRGGCAGRALPGLWALLAPIHPCPLAWIGHHADEWHWCRLEGWTQRRDKAAELWPAPSRVALHGASPGMGRDEGSVSRLEARRGSSLRAGAPSQAPAGLPGPRSARPEPIPPPLPKPSIRRLEPLEGHFIPA